MRVNDGLIDHAKPCAFIFNQQRFTGRQGDTLASALLAQWQASGGSLF